MQRTQRMASMLLGSVLAGTIVAGCNNESQKAANPPAAPAPPPVVPAAVTQVATQPTSPSTSDAAFAPYTVVPQLPPKPQIVTPKHKDLHLTRIDKEVYLVDGSGRRYHVGRDKYNHVRPVYYGSGSKVAYPLYYDRDRDSYYRMARDDNGHYLRGYVDEPASRYYRDDRDYERIDPEQSDQPTITNYKTFDDGYRQPSVSSSHHSSNTNWLWAIPAVIAAYYLLKPHHHSSPQPVYHPQPNRTTIVNNYYNPNRRLPAPVGNRRLPVTVVNNNFYNTAHPPHPVALQQPVVPARTAAHIPPAALALQHQRPHPIRTFGTAARPIVRPVAHVPTPPHARFVLQHRPVVNNHPPHPMAAKPYARPQIRTVAHPVVAAKPYIQPHPIATKPYVRPHPVAARPYVRPQPVATKPYVRPHSVAAEPYVRPQPHIVAVRHVEPARHENRPPALTRATRNVPTRVVSVPHRPMSEVRPVARPVVHVQPRPIQQVAEHAEHRAPGPSRPDEHGKH